MLIYAGEDDSRPVIQLTPDEEADLAEAEVEVERGEFASDEDVAAIVRKYRL